MLYLLKRDYQKNLTCINISTTIQCLKKLFLNRLNQSLMRLIGRQNKSIIRGLFRVMAQVHEMIYMKMTNGEYIYGTNLDIGRYSIKHKCECEHEFDHVPPCKLEGQGGYSDGSKAFKYIG